mmetsp:Transcript_68395/g.198264  ORF Transcript_68395/g.198264 Transcript_68395/m.198264 type:complete len:323 (-) Transcript_68395:22-990(-)
MVDAGPPTLALRLALRLHRQEGLRQLRLGPRLLERAGRLLHRTKRPQPPQRPGLLLLLELLHVVHDCLAVGGQEAIVEHILPHVADRLLADSDLLDRLLLEPLQQGILADARLQVHDQIRHQRVLRLDRGARLHDVLGSEMGLQLFQTFLRDVRKAALALPLQQGDLLAIDGPHATDLQGLRGALRHHRSERACGPCRHDPHLLRVCDDDPWQPAQVLVDDEVDTIRDLLDRPTQECVLLGPQAEEPLGKPLPFLDQDELAGGDQVRHPSHVDDGGVLLLVRLQEQGLLGVERPDGGAVRALPGLPLHDALGMATRLGQNMS